MKRLINFATVVFFSIIFIPVQAQSTHLIADNCCDDEKRVQTVQTADGELIETQLFLDNKELPVTVKNSFEESFYNNWQIDKAIFVTTNTDSFYRIFISYKNEKFQLAFDKEGFMIKDPVIAL